MRILRDHETKNWRIAALYQDISREGKEAIPRAHRYRVRETWKSVLGFQSRALSSVHISMETEAAGPHLNPTSASRGGCLCSELKSMFFHPGMPLDTHLPPCPAVCAAVPMPAWGSNGGGEGGWGSWAMIPTRPWHSSAQHTKGRVNLVPTRAAEELGGGDRGTHRRVATVGLSITQSSQRATQRQMQRRSLGPVLS